MISPWDVNLLNFVQKVQDKQIYYCLNNVSVWIVQVTCWAAISYFTDCLSREGTLFVQMLVSNDFIVPNTGVPILSQTVLLKEEEGEV